MRLAWASDVHFDFVEPEDVEAWCARIRAAQVEGLLLGGDIATAGSVLFWVERCAELLERPLYFVLGNHDYYRGSVAQVREAAARLPAPVHWLPAREPLELAPGLALVGHGGWGDARVGDWEATPVVLNDYLLIEELAAAQREKGPLGQLLRDYGSDAARTLGPGLRAAAAAYERVLVLTHVPPFREACWHEGQTSNDDWAPGFVCGALGELLHEVALEHPRCQLTVLCGHTHSPGSALLGRNLVAHTLGAAYARPDFVVIDTETLADFRPPASPAP